MKLVSARARLMAALLATTAAFWGGVAVAVDFKDNIQQAYRAAGYSNITVKHRDDRWIVTGNLNGVARSFLVDRKTGISTPFDLAGLGNHGGDDGTTLREVQDTGFPDDGPGHDAADGPGGDDHGRDNHGGEASGRDGSGEHPSGHG